MHIVGKNEESAFEVDMVPLGHAIMNGGIGYYSIKVVKNNWHYSLPYFEMWGTITINGEIEEIVGNC